MADSGTHGTFTELLGGIDPDFKKLVKSMRDEITRLDKAYVEIVWLVQGIASYGVGPKKMSEHYLYIAPQKKHVNLGFYHGAVLDDPDGLLEGTGKLLRHIKIKSEAEFKKAGVKRLMKAAIKDRFDTL